MYYYVYVYLTDLGMGSARSCLIIIIHYCLPIDISKDTYKIVCTIANEKSMLLWSVREKGRLKKRDLNR